MLSPSRIEDIRSSQSISVSVILPVFLFIIGMYFLFINILDQIGLMPTTIDTLVLLILVAVSIYGAVVGRTMELAQHFLVGRKVDPLANAMAGSAEWISIFLIIGIVASLTRSNHEAIAIIAGVFGGIALMAIVVIPALSNRKNQRGEASLPQLIAANLSEHGKMPILFRMITAIIIVICAGIILISQINAGSWVLSLYFPQVDPWAKLTLVLIPVCVLVVGGMRSLTITNALYYWLILAALVLPTVWISLEITGNPIPQFGYGGDALRAIAEIENQFQTAGQNLLSDSFGPLSGFMGFAAILLCVLTGSAAFPLLFGRVICCENQAEQGRSVAWTIVFIAVSLSIIPAYVVFANFEIYRDLVGLAILDIPDTTQWLFNWASIGEGQHALVCGRPAFDIATITASCGDDGNHIISPGDLKFSPQLMVLAVGEIAQLPQVISAVVVTGIIAAALSTIAVALMVMVNILAHDLLFVLGDNVSAKTDAADLSARAPIIRRLFVTRLLIIAIGLWAVWISELMTLPGADFFIWVFSLSANLFVVMAFALWWNTTTALGSIIGLIGGFAITLYMQIATQLGLDLIPSNGDELVVHLPYSDQLITALNAGIIGIPVTFFIVISVSSIQKFLSSERNSGEATNGQ